MKIFFLGLCLFLISISAKSSQDLMEAELQGNIKQVVQKSYRVKQTYETLSDNAQPMKILTRNYKNNLLMSTELKINMRSGVDTGEEKDDRNYKIEFNSNYYTDGVKKRTVFYSDGVKVRESIFEYDSKNKLKKITYSNKNVRIFTYGKNSVTETELKLKYGILLPDSYSPAEIYTYNSFNQVATLRYNCKECYEFKFDYNKDHLLEKMTDYKNGIQETEIFYKHLKFDSKGNWLERLEYIKSRVKATLEVREVTYYE